MVRIINSKASKCNKLKLLQFNSKTLDNKAINRISNNNKTISNLINKISVKKASNKTNKINNNNKTISNLINKTKDKKINNNNLNSINKINKDSKTKRIKKQNLFINLDKALFKDQ